VSHLLRGQDVQGSGWLGRAQRLLEDRTDCAAHGYLTYLTKVEGGLGDVATLSDAEAAEVIGTARQVQALGRRHGDRNLLAIGTVGEGRILVKRGRVSEGMALLDEAMVGVLAEDLSPEWAGNIYCHLMAACHELGDVHRAAEWTDATGRWLETLPAAVLFTGICRVHRSQVMQRRGEWQRAEDEARRVCEELDDLAVATVAEAHYQLGDLRRLRGDLLAAEASYQRAHECGRDPQPGRALLCLAEGRTDVAGASIRAALIAVGDDRLAAFPLLVAEGEIALAAGDVDRARAVHGRVADLAAAIGSSGFEAAALALQGAVLLAEGRVEEALPVLRSACRRWRELQAPYDSARACALLARAYRSLGDDDAAGIELAAARDVFARLGAVVDLALVDRLRATTTPALPNGLTAREVEVLALVASGASNRDVAEALVISEKTVARHLSNIFTKVGARSRTEAAAFAYDHELVSPSKR
jgi:ATP/maltotriose-dependent transcriptional regulator MalT